MSSVDWHQAIYVYFDKHERFPALHHLRHEIPLETLRELFTGTWIHAESHYQDMEIIKELFSMCRHGTGSRQLWMMSDEDKKTYNKLKMRRTSVAVYRGCWAENKDGWSWTTDVNVATKFAKRHAPDGFPLVLYGKAFFSDIIAYINERDESEIVILPGDVHYLKIDMLGYQAPSSTNMLFQAIQSGNFWSRDHEVEKMVMTGQLQPEAYLSHLRARLAFFERYKFSDKAELFREVEQRLVKCLEDV